MSTLGSGGMVADILQLDLCDPVRSFETMVPHRASTCTVLINAIFALSSRHLGHIQKIESGGRAAAGHVDPLSTLRYGNSCSVKLRPVLEYDETMSDENMFAAAIILRIWEEMDGSPPPLFIGNIADMSSYKHRNGLRRVYAQRQPFRRKRRPASGLVPHPRQPRGGILLGWPSPGDLRRRGHPEGGSSAPRRVSG